MGAVRGLAGLVHGGDEGGSGGGLVDIGLGVRTGLDARVKCDTSVG